MKQPYIQPKLEVIEIDAVRVLTDSSENPWWIPPEEKPGCDTPWWCK